MIYIYIFLFFTIGIYLNNLSRSVISLVHLVQVGTKVAAVSRKTNTTTHEVLGVMTKENTQIVCILF